MARLRDALEAGGLAGARTFINSGNVLFTHPAEATDRLAGRIEAVIRDAFGMGVAVLVLDRDRLEAIVAAIPPAWVDGPGRRANVIFLFPDVDFPEVLGRIPANPGVDELRYVPGAVLHRLEPSLASRSWLTRMVGGELYRRVTIRNTNTVSRLLSLLETL